MALRTNCIEYVFDTLLTTLACNTTLATSTRHDFAVKTLHIKELVSRSFLSVKIEVSYNTAHTSPTTMTDWRIGIKLGAVAFADTDFVTEVTNTAQQESNIFTLDVTSYFSSNFGAAGTQTCQVAFAMSFTAARNITNVAAKLVITYQYDDDPGATSIVMRTLRIPLQSHHVALTTTFVEVGTVSGATDAPVNQIPRLDQWLPTGAVIRQAWFEITSNLNATANTADYTLNWQIDASATFNRALLEGSVPTGSWFRDLIIYDTATFLVNAAHALKLKYTAGGTPHFNTPCVILYVTYEFDQTAAVTVVNSILVPLQGGKGGAGGMLLGAASAERLAIDLDIQEPGAITFLQSAAVFTFTTYKTVGSFIVNVKAGSQSYRTYTENTDGFTSGSFPIAHRVDHSSGWSVTSRGKHHLSIDVYETAGAASYHGGYAIVNYRSDVHGDGPGMHAHTTNWHINSALASSSLRQTAFNAAGNRTPVIPETEYKLLAAYVEAFIRTPGILQYGIAAEIIAGEYDGDGWIGRITPMLWTNELGHRVVIEDFTPYYNASPNETGKMNIETARGWSRQAHSTCVDCTSLWTTHHTIAYEIIGTVNSFAGDGSGIDVGIFNASDEHVASAVTAIGGAFSAFVYDDTVTHYATAREDASHLGRSDNATPGVGPFHIEFVAEAALDPTAPSITIVSPTPGAAPGEAGGFPSSYQTAMDTPIVLEVTDVFPGIATFSVIAKYIGGEEEVVYRRGSFRGEYIARSSQVAVENGMRLTIGRTGGWPGTNTPGDVTFEIDALDQHGNLNTISESLWQLPAETLAAPLVTPAIVTGYVDHVEIALSRLPYQFQ